MGRFRSFVFSFFLLLILVFLSGCVGLSKFDPVVEINEDGSGQIHIEVVSNYEIDDQINEIMAERGNWNINKVKKNSRYYYDLNFSFSEVTEFSDSASFEVTGTPGNEIYTYFDLVSVKTILGKDEDFIDFKYCVNPPGQVTKLVVDNITDSTYNKDSMACVNISGEKGSDLRAILLVSEKLEGCLYDNPSCADNEDCIDNECVLKEGCLYDNPSCADNEDCIDNECVLKEGCYYNNPPCPEGYNCETNQCVKEVNVFFVIFRFFLGLIIFAALFLAVYFLIKRNNAKKSQ